MFFGINKNKGASSIIKQFALCYCGSNLINFPTALKVSIDMHTINNNNVSQC